MPTTSSATAASSDRSGLRGPSLTVNHALAALDDATPHTSLLDWLRTRGLTGAKEGCAEGECGACAVLVARPAAEDTSEQTEWVALNACLVPVGALDGQEVITVEGLGSPESLHPVQHELASRGGSQCGYCTPGFVCAMAAEFYRPGRDTLDPHALSGNLCRCTGYRPIMEAAEALGSPDEHDPLAARRTRPAPPPRRTRLVQDGAELVRPGDLHEAIDLLESHPEAVVLAGGTDFGVDINLRGLRPPLLVAVDRLAELRMLEVGVQEIRIGAGLTLTEVERALRGRVPILDQLIPQFASRLIRNSATLGGNLATASPIGDAAPVLLALDASVILLGPSGERQLPLEDFFTGYRTTVRAHEELIQEVRIPLPLSRLGLFHKVAKRRFDDISGVAVACAMDVDAGIVGRVRIAAGGIAATPLRARAAEAALQGMPWSAETVEQAAVVLAAEGTPMSDHRASDRYRRAMLEQSLRRLFAETPEVSR